MSGWCNSNVFIIELKINYKKIQHRSNVIEVKKLLESLMHDGKKILCRYGCSQGQKITPSQKRSSTASKIAQNFVTPFSTSLQMSQINALLFGIQHLYSTPAED